MEILYFLKIDEMSEINAEVVAAAPAPSPQLFFPQVYHHYHSKLHLYLQRKSSLIKVG